MYLHDFHAYRDNAMCNIQNHTLPVVQLTHFENSPLKPFEVLALSIANANLKCFSTKWQHAAVPVMEVPG
jgi:hypothetical protein